MAYARAVFTNFTAGELSPRLLGREDIARYENGCSVLENFIVHPHGGAMRRSGTQFVARAKTLPDGSATPLRLVPFQFSRAENYILAFGDGHIRFFADRGVVTEGDGSTQPLELTSPFGATQIGSLQYAQSGDELYLVHPDVPPQVLRRQESGGSVSWSIEPISFTGLNLDGTPADEAKGYPAAIAFFEQRLCLAGFARQPQTIVMSKSADFFNFTLGDLADEGIEYTISTDQVNAIRWMRTGRVLLIGTSGGEFILQGSTRTEPVGPDNISVRRESTYGTEPIMPLYAATAVLFVQRGGRRLRELAFALESDGYRAEDLSLLADHVTRGGITELAYTQVPDSVVWAVRGDGVLLGMTYEKVQKVIGWHRHLVAGGAVESIAVIPDPEGTVDDLWLVVRRTIDGEVRRHIEFLRPAYESGPIAAAFQVDAGLTYDGPPTASVSGLDHVEAAEVDIVADGAPRTRQTVSGGRVDIDPAASVVHVGLPYAARLRTLPLSRGARMGSAMAVAKRLGKVTLRLLDSVGGAVGPDLDRVDALPAKRERYGQALEAFTGDRRVTLPTGWEREGRIAVVQDQPLPFTLLAIVPEIQISG